MQPLPVPFRVQHHLSDWLGCVVEPLCGCGQRRGATSLPVRLLISSYGDITFEALITRLICSACRQKPAPVYLVAGHHQQFCYGGPPDWSVELVPVPHGR